MQRGIWLAMAGSLFGGVAGASEEVALRYRFSAFQGSPVHVMGQKLLLGGTPVERLSRLPRTRSAKPLFGAARLGRGGDTTFCFLLDESRGVGTGYDTLVIDRNNNENLADDPPARAEHRRFARAFGPLPLLISIDGQTRLYHATIETRPQPPVSMGGPKRAPAEYYLKSLGYATGEARFGDRTHPVALVDANGNGIYGDPFRALDFRPETMGDMLLVDADGNGQFDQNGPFTREVLYCGRRVVVDDRFYELSIRPDGSAMRATVAQVPLVAIRSDYPRLGLMLASRDGILPVEGNHVVRVPPGEYRVLFWNIEHPSAEGCWQVSGGAPGSPESARKLILSEREDAAFKLDAPLVAKVASTRNGLPGTIDFQFSLATTSGEAINNVAISGRQPQAPTLRLTDEAGKEVAVLTFHYG